MATSVIHFVAHAGNRTVCGIPSYQVPGGVENTTCKRCLKAIGAARRAWAKRERIHYEVLSL
jgi:hypothetical protein